MKSKFDLHKMLTEPQEPVKYFFEAGGAKICVNEFIGKTIRMQYTGQIHCVNCARPTKKSFNQGYCFPCFQKLAQCDICIVKPELCHFSKGTCREPEWGQTHCMIPHTIYLANSSDVKVGITRQRQQVTRWIDQGAIQALPIFQTKTRFESGLVEVAIKAHISDRSNWRKLLQGDAQMVNLQQIRDEIYEKLTDKKLPAEKINSDEFYFSYPVQSYPTKIATFDFDKTPLVESKLTGIKGQYLLFTNGAMNMRKFAGYEIFFEA